MKVLITEQMHGGSGTVAERLIAAGHSVEFCHRRGNGKVCVAEEPGGQCPLAGNDIDVVVDVRSESSPFTPRELGIACALRSGTPVVVAGPVADATQWPWREADVRCAPDSVVAACEQAASPTGPAAHRAVTAAVSQVLRQAKVALRPVVSLHENRGAIEVMIRTEHGLSPVTREAVRAAARARLATYTPLWQYAQVYFTP